MNDSTADDSETIDALRDVRFRTTPLADERTLRDAKAALRASPRRDWRRSILPRAVAATLLVGAAVGVVAYLDRPALTMADVRQAFVEQAWVRVVYDNGREEWRNLADGTRYEKDLERTGGSVYALGADGTRWSFHRDATFVSRGRWYTGLGAPPRRSPLAEWQGRFEAPAKPPATTLPTSLPTNAIVETVERADDTLDGRRVVRFDHYKRDTIGQRWLARQTWADPATRLPIEVRVPLSAAERQRTGRGAIVGRYSFPTTGPASIFDLGVPRTLPVIDEEAAPAADVAAITRAALDAAARFPTRWRLVVWPGDASADSVDVLYRDGLKRARGRWFTTDVIGGPQYPAGKASADEVVRWTATRTPVERTIADGVRRYDRRDPIPGFVNEPTRASVRVTPFHVSDDDNSFPPGAQWFFARTSHAMTRIVDDVPNVPADVVVLRSEAGDERREYWVDRAHDFICVREAWLRRVDGQWRPEQIRTLDDLARLPTGDWLARRQTVQSFGMPGGYRERPDTAVFRIELRPLAPEEMPPGTFDGALLLEDADVEAR